MKKLWCWIKSLRWWLEPVEHVDCMVLDEMTHEEQEEQRRSFAYGNLKMHNPDITRDDIDKAADAMKGKPVMYEVKIGNFKEIVVGKPKPRVKVKIRLYMLDTAQYHTTIVAKNLHIVIMKNRETLMCKTRKSALRAAKRVANELWPGCEIKIVE